ncbi:MAG: Uma2 family endonuclease [Anaerolineae bacterium]
MVVQENVRLITEADLMALGSDARVEVVEGEIVEMAPVGIRHQFVGKNFYRPLDKYVEEHDLGFVFYDALIYLLDQRGKHLRGARVPDVSFVRKGLLPKGWNIDRPFPGAPTLAIEIVSPDDDAEDLLKRTRDYLRAGSEQVWIAYPSEREVHQHKRGADTVRVYANDSDVIDVEGLFPGLTLTVAEIFKLPELE